MSIVDFTDEDYIGLTERTRRILDGAESIPICPCSPLSKHFVVLWYDGLGTIHGSGKEIPKCEGIVDELREGCFLADCNGRPLDMPAFGSIPSSPAERDVLKQIMEYRKG